LPGKRVAETDGETPVHRQDTKPQKWSKHFTFFVLACRRREISVFRLFTTASRRGMDNFAIARQVVTVV
jgi:hypothetical protein